MGADDLEFHPRIGREVRKFDRAQQAHFDFGKSIGVNHAGILQDFLQETDTADGFHLVPPGLPIARILAQVPLGARLYEIILHAGINLVDQAIQLGCNLVVSLLRKVFHEHLPIKYKYSTFNKKKE